MQLLAEIALNEVGIYVAIIGVYGILIKHMASTSKKLADILLAVNTHIQDKTTHPDIGKIVYADVCQEIQKRHEVTVKSIDDKIKAVDKKLDGVGNGVNALVKALT